MTRFAWSFALLLLFVSAAVSLAAIVPAPPAGRANTETIQLFNGKDLTNFYTWLVNFKYEDPDQVFSVVDAIDGAPAIRVSGKHLGAFITKEEYSDYHLVTEFRWGLATWGGRKDRTKDSGILLHCQGPDGNTGKDFNGPWMHSIECQIIEGGTGDFILVGGVDKDGNQRKAKLTATVRTEAKATIYDPKGEPTPFEGGRIDWFGRDPQWKDTLGFRGRHDIESPDGQWTRVEVICDGDKITNIVNGKVVNIGTKSNLTRGKIIFQSEGAEILFRKIELTPLKK